jgi:hypothetical protein
MSGVRLFWFEFELIVSCFRGFQTTKNFNASILANEEMITRSWKAAPLLP